MCQRNRFGVSPATIRNVMVELEGLGLITHPHTSAGRVPTDRGWRYYVDLLMEPSRLRPEEEELIEGFSEPETDDAQEILSLAARLLGELTDGAGVVLVPQLSQGSYRYLKLIRVTPEEIVAVLISSEGLVRHTRMELAEALAEEELARIEHLLNQELAGMPLAQVQGYLQHVLMGSESPVYPLVKRALTLLSLGNLLEEAAALILEGSSRVLKAPEFVRDMERTRRLVRALEEKEDLIEILRRDLSADTIKIHIGSENRGTPLTDCAIVAAPYRLRGGVNGTLGVVGPTRMNYPRVTAIVHRMAQAVGRAFEG